MSTRSATSSAGPWLGMLLGCCAAVVAGVVIVRMALQGGQPASALRVASKTKSSQPASLGVRATLIAAGITIERTFPSLNFALQPGESLDARLPAGEFEGDFVVRFVTGNIREARVGAIFQGGQLIIKRGDTVLLSHAAGPEQQTKLTTPAISFGRRPQQLTYWFRSDGKQPSRLRAVWQPIESMVPLPLPSDGAMLIHNDSLRGMALAQQFNCAACHNSADEQLQKQLACNPAPILGDVGGRVKPQWIQQWLSDPQALLSGAAMPRLFHQSPPQADAERIEDLTHFLVSMGGPIEKSVTIPDPDLINTGMVSYHTVGCFACHGPLEPLDGLPGGRPSIGMPVQNYSSLGELSTKTTPDHLAAFLRDPVKFWPSGRMPSQNLTDLEARAIAAYLFSRDMRGKPLPAEQPFALDPMRVERGRKHFAATGCGNCHSLGPDRSSIESTLAAPPMESLIGTSLTRGCLAADSSSSGPAPKFGLSDYQRHDLTIFLQSISNRRCNDVPADVLALDMARLNCTACHQFHGERGPEPAIAQYFSTIEEADLGDEGRIPPNLSDVGAKLNPLWMHQVLTEEGGARPYMGTRMPQYGTANVEHFAKLFASTAGVNLQQDDGPASSHELASIGRELVGSKAMNCIQCHTVAGHDSTGTPGPDLALMAERLRFDSFSRWVHDPKLVRPGTRMPSFFVNGQSGFTEHLEGDADKHVQAIWAYLSQGEFLSLPEGLIDPAGLMLEVSDAPIVFRTFIEGAGVRAIACGFPEQIHCAFDGEKCRLALIWQGPFLNAKGAWAARGGSETNPEHVVWTAPNAPTSMFSLISAGADVIPMTARFLGYEFDEQRRPIFQYVLMHGELKISVREQPIPRRQQGRSSFIRRFALSGPENAKVLLDRQQQKLNNPSVRVSDRGNGLFEITLDSQGKAAFDLEVMW